MRTTTPTAEMPYYAEFNASGISWAAVIGGAFVAAAFALLFTFLGLGIGLSAISPWTRAGASAKTIGAGAIIWMILTHIFSMGVGGYLAGRLRTKWNAVHSDEVYFRDTAHGLLVWAVAVVATAAFLTTALSIVGSGAVMGPASAAVGAAPLTPGGVAPAPAVPGAPGMQTAPAPIPQTTITTEDVEKARKAAARGAIWMFIAMLIGALSASIAALIGGRQRDSVVYYEVETGTRSRQTYATQER